MITRVTVLPRLTVTAYLPLFKSRTPTGLPLGTMRPAIDRACEGGIGGIGCRRFMRGPLWKKIGGGRMRILSCALTGGGAPGPAIKIPHTIAASTPRRIALLILFRRHSGWDMNSI